MSATLDRFIPSAPKPAQPEPKEKCSNPKCRKELSPKDPKYTLRLKGKESVYCPSCAKEILHPQENMESL